MSTKFIRVANLCVCGGGGGGGGGEKERNGHNDQCTLLIQRLHLHTEAVTWGGGDVLINGAVDTDGVPVGAYPALMEDKDGHTHAQLEVAPSGPQTTHLQVVAPDNLVHVDGILRLKLPLEIHQ